MSLPEILSNHVVPAGESKGAKQKRHTKERKDLELLIRQQKVANKVGNQWLAQLAQLQAGEDQKEAQDENAKILEDLKMHNAKLSVEAQKSMNTLKQLAEQEKATALYQQTEMRSDKEVEMAVLEELLKKEGLKMKFVPADGNCLYSALQLVSGERDLRGRLVKYVESNIEVQEQVKAIHGDLMQYLQGLKSTEWGDELEISLLSDLLKRPIRVLSARFVPIIYNSNIKAKTIDVVFCEHQIAGAAHYNAAVFE